MWFLFFSEDEIQSVTESSDLTQAAKLSEHIRSAIESVPIETKKALAKLNAKSGLIRFGGGHFKLIAYHKVFDSDALETYQTLIIDENGLYFDAHVDVNKQTDVIRVSFYDIHKPYVLRSLHFVDDAAREQFAREG